jgi:hypothetical protein
MKKLLMFIAMAHFLFLSGCLAGISGKVVDGMTGRPIEKALVVAQWTKEHGFGLTYHDLYKIVETETDKEGNFSIDGAGSPFVEQPQMIIYKEGYIPWRNDTKYPSTDIVKDHEWKDNMTYKLEVFTDDFSYEQLYGFLEFSIIGLGLKETSRFTDVMHKISGKRFEEIENKRTIKMKP